MLEKFTDTIACTPDGNYVCKHLSIQVKDSRDHLSLVERLNDYPVLFKTTDDAVIEKNEICMGAADSVIFVPDEIFGIDWDKHQTTIRREFGANTGGKKSIQTTLNDLLLNDAGYTYILYDHGTGEIADYITVIDNENTIEVGLFHVKAMRGRNFNSDLSDIYEVTQQAVKSTIWLKSRATLLDKIRSRRRSNHCELKKGSFAELERTLKQNKLLTTKIFPSTY